RRRVGGPRAERVRRGAHAWRRRDAGRVRAAHRHASGDDRLRRTRAARPVRARALRGPCRDRGRPRRRARRARRDRGGVAMTLMRLVRAAVTTILATVAITVIGVEPLFALGYGLLAGVIALLMILRRAGSAV